QPSRQREADAIRAVEVKRQSLRKYLTQTLEVFLRRERCLLFPLPRREVSALLLERSMAKLPSRSPWQDAHVLEQRAVFQYASATDVLAKSALINRTQFRPHREQRLCLRCKIESVVRLVVVD